MSRKKLLIILVSIFICFSIMIPLGFNMYNNYKCKNIIEKTNIELTQTIVMENKLKQGLDDTSFILLNHEKEKLLQNYEEAKNKLDIIKSDIVTYKNLNGAKEIRAKLEDGYIKSSDYKTPIIRLQEVQSQFKTVISFCSNRQNMRNRIVENEMLLKSILKKPVSGIEMDGDLAHINKYKPQFVLLVPQLDNNISKAFETIPEKNLFNSLGVKLFNSLKVLDDIKQIAQTEEIKGKAENMWVSAKKSYLNVKDANDNITWYMPINDDGNYDTEKYKHLLQQQNTALAWYENGNAFINNLIDYKQEIETQELAYVSSQSYEDKTYRHSRRVARKGYRSNSKGERESYTYYETEYFSTPGRKFFYTITKVKGHEKTFEKVEVGEKDSHDMLNSFGNWKTWDYLSTQNVGYLIKYKPFGYDNSFIVNGGVYDPRKHIIK